MHSTTHITTTAQSSTRKDSSSQVLASLSLTRSALVSKTFVAETKATPASQIKLGPTLPVLEALKEIIPTPEEGGPSFKNIHFLSAQHLLETTLNVFEFALQRGLDPKHAVVIGKEYSTNKGVEEKLRNAGIQVIDSPALTTLYGFDDSYEEGCREACETSVRILKEAKDFTPLIHDDGGRLAKILGKGSFQHSVLKKAPLIEQTSSGATSLEHEGAAHPRINMYGATLKKIGEAPLVAKVTVTNAFKLVDKIHKLNSQFKSPEESIYGVRGIGVIGTAVVKELASRGVREIRVFDLNPDRIKAAKVFGSDSRPESLESMPSEERPKVKPSIEGEESDRLLMANVDVLIGTTGETLALPAGARPSYFNVSRPHILLSGSSRQIEFLPFLEYNQTLEAQKAKEEKRSYTPKVDISETIILKNGWKGMVALPQLGTPITFDKSPNAVPANEAQLIRALIIVSLVQNLEVIKDRAEAEKLGKSFDNIGYKVSPLLQLFIAKNFIANFEEKELLKLYTKKDLENMTNLQYIIQDSAGETYLPFEKKVRQWLDTWLKENNLTQVVDNCLFPVVESTQENISKIRMGLS